MDTFDDIKAYYGEDYKVALERLMKDESFHYVTKHAFGDKYEQCIEAARQSTSFEQLHKGAIFVLLQDTLEKSSKGITISGTDRIGSDKPYLYITNHRDIILDSGFLQFTLYQKGKKGSEIAIGNNLLIYPWISDLVRINRSFIVKRDLGIRESIVESRRLSAYIRDRISNLDRSIWLAQSEGRTKNGNDLTQTGILKMLSLSGGKDIIESIKEFNIIPVAISYEFNPCASSFAYESFMKKNDPDFKKAKKDDIENMVKGVVGFKGRVHYGYGQPLNDVIDNFSDLKNNKEKILEIKAFIDNQVHKNYKLHECNFISYDLKNNSTKFTDKYTSEDKAEFLKTIDVMKDDYEIDFDYLTEYIINMTAGPVENYLKTL